MFYSEVSWNRYYQNWRSISSQGCFFFSLDVFCVILFRAVNPSDSKREAPQSSEISRTHEKLFLRQLHISTFYLKKVVFEEIHGSLCAKHVVQNCHQPTTTWTKNGPKMDPIWTKNGPKYGPKMDPIWTAEWQNGILTCESVPLVKTIFRWSKFGTQPPQVLFDNESHQSHKRFCLDRWKGKVLKVKNSTSKMSSVFSSDIILK